MSTSKTAAERDLIVTQIALSIAANGRLVGGELMPLLERLAPLVGESEGPLVTLLADCVREEDARSMRMRFRIFLDVFAALRADLRDYQTALRTQPAAGSLPRGRSINGERP